MDKRLMRARDLQTTNEYGVVDGRKVIVATTRSSKSLGLSEREEVSTSRTAADQAEPASTKSGRKSRKGEGE